MYRHKRQKVGFCFKIMGVSNHGGSQMHSNWGGRFGNGEQRNEYWFQRGKMVTNGSMLSGEGTGSGCSNTQNPKGFRMTALFHWIGVCEDGRRVVIAPPS
jgi:hypothetical protein